MKPTLLVLAAGMGSRFGGLKQMEPVGPSGETIIDYSVYDALRSGFGKVVFVIRRSMEQDFRELVGKRFEKKIQVEYAFQELDLLPEGFDVPPGREKPWGTAHAVLAAESCIQEPFAAINGDDYYGAHSFQSLAGFLQTHAPAAAPLECAMVGFVLRHTLSDHGHVSRGVCEADERGFLKDIEEITKIERDGEGAVCPCEDGGQRKMTGDEIVSMNLWGLPDTIFPHLREGFERFLKERGGELKSECYLPFEINRLIHEGKAQVKILTTPDSWFGVTYREDKAAVDAGIRKLVEEGLYPEKLWAE